MTTATITVAENGSATIDLDGHPPRQLHADDLAQARQQAVAVIIDHARQTGQPVTLLARDTTTEHLLDVHPDGTVLPSQSPVPPPRNQGDKTDETAAVGPPRRWPRALAAGAAAAAVAAGLTVSAAHWMRPTPQPQADTATTAPTASTAPAATPPVLTVVDADTLGVIAAARSQAPRPTPLPSGIAPVAWNGAATWQQRRRELLQSSRPAATGTTAATSPVPAAPPAAVTPANPTVQNPATVPERQPQVIIKPAPAPPRPAARPAAPKPPAGPAMPDQPTNPTNPD